MTNKEIGETIRTMRQSRSMTQEELALAANLSQSSITMYESGKRRPSKEAAEALADAFNVPLWAIYYKEDEVIPNSSTSEKQKPLPPKPPVANPDNITSVFTLLNAETKPNEPDYETAALRASQAMINHRVSAMPVEPLTILKNTPNIVVVTFTEMAGSAWVDSAEMVSMFGASSQDAVTYGTGDKNIRRYIVAYNQRLPYYMIQMALARELGHIMMGHNDSRTDDVRTAEALYFARYLLCPRPLIKALQDAKIPLTIETVGNLTGCYGRTIASIGETPGAHVDPALNRQIKAQLSAYVENIIAYQSAMRNAGSSNVMADFGTFMDNYEE